MPETFVADLLALVDSFERALRDRGAGTDARRVARASTKAALASGLAAVRSLDAIVTNHLRDDAVTRTVWERDRRIVHRERAKGTEATPEAAPGPAEPESPTGSQAA